jgi:DNA-binding NarL/FixJ family response regulator
VSLNPSPDRPRVLVADDYQAMLENLTRLLEVDCDVVAAVTNGRDVVTEAQRLHPDVLVLDISMPGMSGIAAARELEKRGSIAKVVFVTMHHDREFVEQSLALGAVGFVTKDRLIRDLMPAIRAVLEGQAFVSPNVPTDR